MLYDNYLNSLALIFFQPNDSSKVDNINRTINRVHLHIDRFYNILCNFCNTIISRLGDGLTFEMDLNEGWFESLEVEKRKLDDVVELLKRDLQLDVMTLTNVKNQYFEYIVGCSSLLSSFVP